MVCCCSLMGTRACETCRNKSDICMGWDKQSILNPIKVIEKENGFKTNKTTLEKLDEFFQEIKMLPETEIDRILNIARKEVDVEHWCEPISNYIIKWE